MHIATYIWGSIWQVKRNLAHWPEISSKIFKNSKNQNILFTVNTNNKGVRWWWWDMFWWWCVWWSQHHLQISTCTIQREATIETGKGLFSSRVRHLLTRFVITEREMRIATMQIDCSTHKIMIREDIHGEEIESWRTALIRWFTTRDPSYEWNGPINTLAVSSLLFHHFVHKISCSYEKL